MVDAKLAEFHGLIPQKAKEWLNEQEVEKWVCAYDTEGCRWRHMTTNLVECMNNMFRGVRHLPVMQQCIA